MKFLLATLTIALVALQFRLWVGEGSIGHVVQLNREISQQSAENDRLKARNNLLAAEVSALKTGTDGIEARARHQMGMIKEGETFFMIVEESH